MVSLVQGASWAFGRMLRDAAWQGNLPCVVNVKFANNCMTW
jgi:uncharacterized protein (UPF0303 family)